MFNLNKQADYGLIILSLLIKEDKQTSLTSLIKTTKLPQRFLARIAATLVHNGLLKSKEGRAGGYTVTKKINTISLFEYLKIFSGEVNFCSCTAKSCEYSKICQHKDFLQKRLNKLVTAQLKKIRLLELFKKLFENYDKTAS